MSKSLKTCLETILQEPITVMNPGSGRIATLSGKQYFLKQGASSDSFRCEANGLNELKKAKAIRIAEVIGFGDNFILTAYFEAIHPPKGFFENFGRKMAQLHRYHAPSYGFYENNFIGRNPQINIPSEKENDDWSAFFYEKRLLYQYKMLLQKGLCSMVLRDGFNKLEAHYDRILNEYKEAPTLLHGDLWSGNFLCDREGEPVLIDPAVYYGHREADLAMTRLFGSFSTHFYEAYQEPYPLAPGWEYRENIYKLYHVLNHLNLFGGGYLIESEHLIKSL